MELKEVRFCQLCNKEAICKYLLVGMYAVNRTWVCKPCRLEEDAKANPGFRATLKMIWKDIFGPMA